MNRELPDVIKVPGVGYAVKSLSKPGYWTLVSGKDCDCDAAQNGAKQCRHRKLVETFVRAQADDYKRPAPKLVPEFFS